MEPIEKFIKEKNIQLDTIDPMLRQGFIQMPVFIMQDPAISVGAKVAYSLFLSYAWANDFCFPGHDKLAEGMGLTRVRVTQLVAELKRVGLVTIRRRGQGRTNYYTIHFQVKSGKVQANKPVDKNP